jgi:DNA-directed RNA polymerase subunit RPC12/RpoP
MSERFPEIDWWCDRCGAQLNNQFGFDDNKYTWKCTECGHKNSISRDNIYESHEDYWNENNE